MALLSVVVITYNEEKNIDRCLSSVKEIADEIVVIDSFSDDHTVEIARKYDAVVKRSAFDGYINQKNKAINLASNDLVLLLDADESLSPELRNSIARIKDNIQYCAYSMNRCAYFCGKFIRRGLWYPDKKLRLFDKRLGRCGGMNPHDKIIMDHPTTVKHLNGDLIHYTYDSLEEYLERNDAVSTIAAQSLFDAGIKKHWSKMFLSPAWAFFNGYILRLGFLDGDEGFAIAVHTASQSFYKYQKLRKLYKQELKKVMRVT